MEELHAQILNVTHCHVSLSCSNTLNAPRHVPAVNMLTTGRSIACRLVARCIVERPWIRPAQRRIKAGREEICNLPSALFVPVLGQIGVAPQSDIHLSIFRFETTFIRVASTVRESGHN